MGHAGKLEGELVSEEYVAKGLGFPDVNEFRRWQTELGKENAELKYALSQARDEAKRFQWAGLRQQAILEKAEEWIKQYRETINVRDYPDTKPFLDKLLLAIGVVCGRGVDWENALKDWLDPINEAIRERQKKADAIEAAEQEVPNPEGYKEFAEAKTKLSPEQLEQMFNPTGEST